MVVRVNFAELDQLQTYINILIKDRFASPLLTTLAHDIEQVIYTEPTYKESISENFGFINVQFSDTNNNPAKNIQDVFDYEWNYNEYRDDNYVVSLEVFCNMVSVFCEYADQSDFITDKDFIITCEDNVVPLNIAKKMYASDDKDIRNYIKTLYDEQYLIEPHYYKYKTCDDVEHASLNIDMFIKYINGNKFDYINNDIWIPIIKIVKNADSNDKVYGPPAAKFKLNGQIYTIYPGRKSEFFPIKGIFNYDNDVKVGGASVHCTKFACYSKEFAMYVSKYFARLLFESIFEPMSGLYVIKWMEV